MTTDMVFVDVQDNIGVVGLNRPSKKNSLSIAFIDQLRAAFDDLAHDHRVRVLVLRGHEAHPFCSGFDINALPIDNDGHQLARLQPVESLFRQVTEFPYPVIAMINKLALGAGCELALCCDIRIASQTARMGMPPAKLGIVYSWAGLKRFIQTIGASAAKEMFFTGRVYSGQPLLDMGLVHHLMEPAMIETYTARLAAEIAGNAPLALKGIKRIFNLIQSTEPINHEGRQQADELMRMALNSADLKEGRRAFFEKRKPRFTGQ